MRVSPCVSDYATYGRRLRGLLLRALDRLPTVANGQSDEAFGQMAESMDFRTGREIALIGVRLLDDAYMAWVAAESETEEALRAWFVSGEHRAAYQTYRAAVDREEAAARDLQRLHELTAVCLDTRCRRRARRRIGLRRRRTL